MRVLSWVVSETLIQVSVRGSKARVIYQGNAHNEPLPQPRQNRGMTVKKGRAIQS